MKKFSEEWLCANSFKQCSWIDKNGKHPYYYRFNVYRSNNDVSIDCEITIYDDGAFDIDVYDGNFGRAKYAPWYSGDDTDIVRKIKKKVDKVVGGFGLYD